MSSEFKEHILFRMALAAEAQVVVGSTTNHAEFYVTQGKYAHELQSLDFWVFVAVFGGFNVTIREELVSSYEKILF